MNHAYIGPPRAARGERSMTLDVLVFDGEADATEMLTLRLRRRGHRVTCADHLAIARMLLSVRCFDLALIDLAVGGGIAAAEVALARIPRPRLVAVTGWALGSVRDAAEAAFDEVRTKPLSRSDLDAILHAARLAREGAPR